MMYKAVNGKIALQIPEYVKPKPKITRQCHCMKFTHITPESFYAKNWLYPSGTHLLLE